MKYKVIGDGSFFFPLLRMRGNTGDILDVPLEKTEIAELYDDKLEKLEEMSSHKTEKKLKGGMK
jgi:hypothetical protein